MKLMKKLYTTFVYIINYLFIFVVNICLYYNLFIFSVQFEMIIVENYLFELIANCFGLWLFDMVFFHYAMFNTFKPKLKDIFFTACVLVNYERQIERRKDIILAIIEIYYQE